MVIDSKNLSTPFGERACRWVDAKTASYPSSIGSKIATNLSKIDGKSDREMKASLPFPFAFAMSIKDTTNLRVTAADVKASVEKKWKRFPPILFRTLFATAGLRS